MESRLSLAILAVLVIVAGGVWLRQFRFNPAVIAMRPAAQAPLAETAMALPPLVDTAGSDIAPFSASERFTPETLYEKIDGRADLYLASGFVSLSAQRFSPRGNSGSWVEVFAYEMATPANAFSVFSMQRRDGARADDLAPSAYRTQNALFLVQGQYYLELVGTDASPSLHGVMNELARRFIAGHGGARHATSPGAALFPAEGMAADTLQLINANAFGYAELDQIYTAKYTWGETDLIAFVSERQNADDARELARTYARLLETYGATRIEMKTPITDDRALQLFDTVDIVIHRGKYFAGVHEAVDRVAAESLARRLAKHLEGILASGSESNHAARSSAKKAE